VWLGNGHLAKTDRRKGEKQYLSDHFFGLPFGLLMTEVAARRCCCWGYVFVWEAKAIDEWME
jgi:hypothetical protein